MAESMSFENIQQQDGEEWLTEADLKLLDPQEKDDLLSFINSAENLWKEPLFQDFWNAVNVMPESEFKDKLITKIYNLADKPVDNWEENEDKNGVMNQDEFN